MHGKSTKQRRAATKRKKIQAALQVEISRLQRAAEERERFAENRRLSAQLAGRKVRRG